MEFPPGLPISARAEEIVAAIQTHPVLVLTGETGSGKTTQIPKLCLAAGRGQRGRIGCTQPRRVAALAVSQRVAEELRVTWGREVGCKIRFRDDTSPETVIKFLTDGMLLAEAQGDALLREYDTLIIDEAHERSLNIDFLLGLLCQVRARRPELKIIITSATIDPAVFSRAFGGAPVIEVSGRMFPVEVIYAPLHETEAEPGEGAERTRPADRATVVPAGYIEGAVEAVRRIVDESPAGDVLVFMPSERDIRETCDQLAGLKLRGCLAVPLFGRLGHAEQQRVFAPTPQRKVVVATNIAETSLTIPGIRFVVDTGLTRISRYAPQTRTRRLPIEPVAQANADQRKGRCGRVAEGVCIRLYTEEDFLARPKYAQPEIQRANLADVILRMMAFGLGEIDQFPFLNAPAAKAVQAGYNQLEELGAFTPGRGDAPAGPAHGQATPTAARALTPLGLELARLPVDPAVGRMILQARREKALREVLVIAAALSIQDPRERPLDKRAQADAAHHRFQHPDSDFLTLLNIWHTYHGRFEAMTQSKLRKFCRDHFLSFVRLREWRDIHDQLAATIREDAGTGRLASAWAGLDPTDAKATGFGTPSYRAIHRSLLSGLLANIARRDEAGGGYKGTHERKIALFPGSVLARREEKKSRAPAGRPRQRTQPADAAPRWFIAAEITETSRLYARTCARLDPQWVVELDAPQLRTSYREPFWDEAKGRVLVKRHTQLYGLEVEVRAVSYGAVEPLAATEIFIREALVNDTITRPLPLLEHNRGVRRQVEDALARTRNRGSLGLDEAVYQFYAARLLPEGKAEADFAGVSSVDELAAWVRKRHARDAHCLEMRPEDLFEPDGLLTDAAEYPPSLPLDNRVLPLQYAYHPGQTDDGVTLELNPTQADGLTPAALDRAVPGHLRAKVEHYLRALPKELRKALVPLAETAAVAAEALRARLVDGPDKTRTLTEALAGYLAERHQVRVQPEFWGDKPLPDHLQVRVRVVDEQGRELCVSRDLAGIRAALHARQAAASRAAAREEPPAWQQARRRWEKSDQTAWTFGDVPERVAVSGPENPVWAFPGIKAGVAGVSLRLYPQREEAEAATREGLARLLELQLRHDLGWLERDLRSLRELGALASTLVPVRSLQEQALESVRRWVCDAGRMRQGAATDRAWLTEQTFVEAVEQGRRKLRGIAPRLCDLLREILSLRQELLVLPQAHPGLAGDVAALLPPDFVGRTPYQQLHQLPRYLKAMKLRAERWRRDPIKDRQRAAQLAPYVQSVRELTEHPGADGLRWLVEEFRVSLFAQELGTAEPVSAVKLDRLIASLRQPGRLPAGKILAEQAASAMAARPVPNKKAQVKSLESLGQLFPR